MKCFVCGGEMEFFLNKDFNLENLSRGEYFRCPKCGLVISKTLYEMAPENWRALNLECHESYQGTENCSADPRWLERLQNQAEMLAELFRRGIFGGRSLDYGCGDGKLAALVEKLLGRSEISNYDEFMARAGYLTAAEISARKFDLVITCSVFEHLLGERDFDKIFDLLTPAGTFALHTLIAEEIPRDASWFYFLPPHCTFLTNRAMAILFERYKFKGCAYNVGARMWLFFRDEEKFRRLEEILPQLSGAWSLDKKFVDYWKAKPYR